MNRIAFLRVISCFLLSITLTTNAQDITTSPVLMTVNGKPITKADFENVYHKNHKLDHADTTQSLDNYVDLFINFKLKVAEAVELGLDTSEAFKKELAGYRYQLAKPYLTDNKVNDLVVKETYERLKENVCTSHILVKCDQDALAKDTLKAYAKTIKIRNRILKGEDFNKVASEIGAGGFLGCFTAMQMVPAFETAAYTAKIGEVSMPVRTRFGYHLVYVSQKEKAKGELLTAHIMIITRPDMTKADSVAQLNKIAEIYKRLKAGEDFAKLAFDFSDDKATAEKGGELPWIGVGATPKEFEDAAFNLKNIGDFSEPVRTSIGVHIVKLKAKKELGSYESLEKELKTKLAKLGRFNVGREALVDTLKKQYNFQPNDKTMASVKLSLLNTKAKPVDAQQVLFSLNKKTTSVGDFVNYVEMHKKQPNTSLTQAHIDKLYERFVEETIVNYENTQLEGKYPIFKSLMQEYYDGMLLFELTDQKIWSKAVKDTVGLKAYYEANKSDYKWDERADASVYTCANATIAKKASKMAKKGKSEEQILQLLNTDSPLNVKAESKLFVKKENSYVDGFWHAGTSKGVQSTDKEKIIVVHVKAIVPASVKTFAEARGMIVSNYQNQLEKEWIAALKKNYKVVVNKEVLSTIK
jgi:peptidyl-prolyl cis-trans isomerase SurA